MIRKISFSLFLSLCCCIVFAQETASSEVVPVSGEVAAVPAAPAFEYVDSSQRDFASLKKDVETSVARLDQLRRQRDAASGQQKAKLAAQVDAVYEHISRLRREVADFAVRTEAVNAQRRLESQRQQRDLSRQHTAQQQRMIAQQQRLRQQQEQRRLNMMRQ